MAAEGRRGLGRGLSALLDENAMDQQAPALAATVPGGVRELPIEMIRRNREQPRKVFADEELDDLAASIRQRGVLQPILVRPLTGAAGEYEIVAGERRWRAAQRAGLRDVPVVVREFSDRETLEIAIVENVQRSDLNPIEEAAAYRALIDTYGHTQEAVAEAVGKSRPHIANALRLLALPDEVREHVLQGRLSAGHARAVAAASDPAALARQVIERGLNVRDAEALARQSAAASGGASHSARPAGAKRGKDADTLALENDLAEALGLHVEVIDKGGQGELRVRYATLEQLDDLCRRLSRG
jgi:ParB family chromosome partitioning protein